MICVTHLLIISCEKETDQTKNSFSDYEEMYKDSTFLSIQGDLTNPDVIWSNMDVYSIACERMHRHLLIDTIHERLEWNFSNASNLKISENIYKYIINCWTYDCNTLKGNNYRLIKDGIYYKIDYGSGKPQTKTPQYLDQDFNLNMQMCCQLIKNQVTGPLANYFDISYTGSLLKPDGYGGYKIYQERKGSCGIYHYYIFIAQNYRKNL